MSDPAPYYPGKVASATDENLRNDRIREGQISGGPGILVGRGRNGTTVSLQPRPAPRTVLTIGGAVVVTEAVNYTDTPVQITLEPPNTTEILGAVTGKMTDPDGLLDLDSATPSITLTHPGRYLIHYRATCGYADSCATSSNLSDAVTRLRLDIGGTLRDETAVYGTHHAKLCATGLALGVGTIDITGTGITTDMNPVSGSYGAVSGSAEVTLTAVDPYDRWTGGKVTISGTFQVLVIMDDTGAVKIATTAPVEPSTASSTCAPTISLWVDRSDVEPPAGVDPFTDWNADPELTLHEAQIHLIRLC